MVIVRTVSELDKALRHQAPGIRRGFVPTMGSLHAGHLSLLAASTNENDVTVASVFVNPKQFDNPDDYKNYPRDEAADCRLLDKHGCDLAFIPDAGEIYDGYDPPPVELGPMAKVMEGEHRPGHFDGMALVVRRLFELVRPGTAYFGEKDFQQLAIIKRLVRQAGLPVRVKGCPTVREADGLAMSSRNVHLTPDERKAAPAIYESMLQCKTGFRSGKPAAALIAEAGRRIEENGLLSVEYLAIVDPDTGAPVRRYGPSVKARMFAAVRTSSTRLIDNLAL